ncbi:MAG TPA: aminotransferase class V-fold PLP-dependent enzyme [Longimicrobiales bacterium]|nr:aminotransferase class V-fold PLP-dependent enzyme [Longimicrobiales bacterium]
MRETRLSSDSPLALEPERFRVLGHQMVDRLADFLASLPERPVVPAGGPDELRALLGGVDAPLPERGADPERLLAEAATLLTEHSTFNAHPRFFGYITAGPAPIGILGDFLASAINPNCGGWTLSPMASEIEGQAVRWIAELIDYPRQCGGLLVSGGNMANFTCFLAARTAIAGAAVRAAGLTGAAIPRFAVYVSGETHTWIQKAADLFGLGTDAVRWIPTDAELRMDVSALRRAMADDAAAGWKPLLVVGTAGSVSTGAVDPLREIEAACREHGAWFHIDGAYGAFAAAVPDAAPELAHLALADSVAVDPHKWLYAPLEAGCALVRDAEALRGAFSYHPAYYHFGQEATNYVDFGPQNSRGFRALKVWLALRQAGREGYAQSIGDDIALARRLHEKVAAHPELEPATLGLSISTFRYVPEALRAHVGGASAEEALNTLNEALLDRLQKAGEAFVSNAVVDGRYLLRACIVNFNTTTADVDALPDIVARTGREVAGELEVSA